MSGRSDFPPRAASSTPGALVGLLVGTLVGCAGEGAPERSAELSAPVVLAESGGSQPTTASTSAGRILTAWVGADNNVWLRADDGSPAVRVNDIDGDAAPHAQAPAQVATGPGDEVYVVWHNATPIEGRRFPASDLRFARSGDGGRTFEPAVTVNDDAGGTPTSHTFQDLVVARDGSLIVSWIDSRAREGVGSHEESGGHHKPPAGERGPEIRVARSEDGGRTFAESPVVAVDACPCCRTAMAVAPDGALYLAWRHIFDGNVRDIVVARSEDGGRTFGAPVRVHEDDWVFDGCPHAGPALAVADDGTLHVAWYTGKEGASGLYRALSEDRGASFGSAIPLLAGEWVPPSTARLSVTDDGELWVAWEDKRAEPVVALARVAEGVRDARLIATFPGTAPALARSGGAGISMALLAASAEGVVILRSEPVGPIAASR